MGLSEELTLSDREDPLCFLSELLRRLKTVAD